MIKKPAGLDSLAINSLNLVNNYDGKISIYKLRAMLGQEKNKIYRIARDLRYFGYIEIKNKKMYITKFGKIVHDWIFSKNAPYIYKKQKSDHNMQKVNCTDCGKPVFMEKIKCIDCSEKELEELNEKGENTCPCDYCGKELIGITADQEINLFYKDADKDYNFCSKDCLQKFIQEKLE